MIEQWLPIKGFEGLYEVSNLGRVKSLDRYIQNSIDRGGIRHKSERILRENRQRYSTVVLCKDGKTYPRVVHRLVADAFLDNPENKPTVDHIDTNPFNNNVNNLRWCTQKENINNPLSRKHNSESKKGHKYWGRPLTSEEKEKISKALKGRHRSEEHRKHLSEALKGRPGSKANTGKHWKLEGGKRVWY